MYENPELSKASQLIEHTGTHLFLTGKAGTGKTTFLRRLKEHSPKRMIVVAPTGIAAINAEGVTIHSFFQLPFAPYIPESTFNSPQNNYRFGKEKIRILRSIDLLVIDEISMVRADLLDAIDAVLRRYRNRYLPFGGVQMLMIGDLQQLAPVVKPEEWELLGRYYETPYFFSSHALKQTAYATIELKQVFRQKDPRFLEILNKIRENKADKNTLDLLNRRCIPDFRPPQGEKYIRLTTHNRQAQSINEERLSELSSPAFAFEAKISGNFPEYSYPTERTLVLKKGAQVMFVKNDHTPEKRYYNGMIGEISRVDRERVCVRSENTDKEIVVEPTEWSNNKYILNEETKEITEEVEGVFKQYPLKPAWAITIHKSQGLTFDRAIIDAQAAFAHGQTYVALSRCKSLEGLVLSTPLSERSLISDTTVDDYTGDMEKRMPDETTIRRMEKDYYLTLVNELFDFSPVKRAFQATTRLIDEHFYRLYPQTLEQYKSLAPSFKEKIEQVAFRFKNQYERLIDLHEDYADSEEIRTRFRSGARYFGEELRPFMALAEKTALPTDNKELKKKAEASLEELWTVLYIRTKLMEHVKENGFQVTDYLKKKAVLQLDERPTEKSKEKKEKKKKSPVVVPENILHPELYRALSEWRAEKAKKENLPAYCIFQQKALLGFANLLPDDPETLVAIPYFGKKGADKYGVEILGIIRSYLKAHHLERSAQNRKD